MIRSILLAAAMLAATPALAQTPAAASTSDKGTLLVLRGTGTVEAQPDFATLAIGVQTEMPKAVDAMNQNNKAMADTVAAIKAAGIPAKDIITSRLTLNPAYEFPPQGRRTFRGYAAGNTVRVTVRDLSKLSNAIDAGVSAGGNTINGVSFGVDKPDAQLKEARIKAVQDATVKAEQYAAAMGLKVKRVVSASEPGVTQPIPSAALQQVDFVGGVVNFSTPVETGELRLYATLDVTFELVK